MKRVVLLAALLLATSCSSTRPGVSNGSVTVCFRAIPVAKAALNDKHATLIGVHRVAVDHVRADLPPAVSAEMNAENDKVVCAVAFKDNFLAGQVDLAPSTEQGQYAVVLVTSRHLHLVRSFVLAQLPSAFGKRTL